MGLYTVVTVTAALGDDWEGLRYLDTGSKRGIHSLFGRALMIAFQLRVYRPSVRATLNPRPENPSCSSARLPAVQDKATGKDKPVTADDYASVHLALVPSHVEKTNDKIWGGGPDAPQRVEVGQPSHFALVSCLGLPSKGTKLNL